eukprot:m.259670 g.259670  ORF g.259670 m.259670 type:complete len:209 (-) comp38497_c0_seq1:121-747(-)
MTDTNEYLGVKEIKYAGFLIKQGKVIKNWKNRWFEVGANGLMKYYRQSPGDKFSVPGSESGTIDLTQCVQTLKGPNIAKKTWPETNLGNCFAMVLPHRTYYLIARTPNEVNDWLSFINVFKGKEDGDRTPVECESESEDEEEKEPDSFSCLSSMLQGNVDIEVSRSNSVVRGRVDTDHGDNLVEESNRISREEAKTIEEKSRSLNRDR